MIFGIIKTIYRFLYWTYYNLSFNCKIENKKISPTYLIGKNVKIRRNTEIYGEFKIGKHSYISGPNTFVNNAIIGNFCSIARNVIIGPGNHNISYVSTSPYFYPNKSFEKNMERHMKVGVFIKNDVWIGANCIILDGVSIGNGAVIAAGSVVTHDVDDYAVVGGVPARFIKFRFEDDQMKLLNESAWWDWDDKKLSDLKAVFTNIEDFSNNINKIDKR